MFNAIYLTQENKATHAELKRLDESQLPPGDVDVRVEYSTINFKDALAITGRSPIVRNWPMVAGIDLAGTVESSRNPAWKQGDRVVVTGWGLGELHWGGLAQKARLPSEWLLSLPDGFSTHDAMTIATAGFTAALSVMALQQQGVNAGDGEVLVTGAAGGLGSISVALLAGLGYEVAASTGRLQESDYLRFLGATRIIERGELSAPGKPLQSERWAGVIDSVGSHTLANACAQTRRNGAVAVCGLAQGGDLPATVMPFLLRGITLRGISSGYVPNHVRAKAWELLARHVGREKLERMTVEIALSQAIDYATLLLDGKVRGRIVVNVNKQQNMGKH